MRRFSRRLFGADAGEVKQFLDETASTINRLQNELEKMKSQLAAAGAERSALQVRYKEAQTEVEKLRAQVTVAEDVIDAYQAQDSENTQSDANSDALQKKLMEVTAESEELRSQLKEATAEAEKLRGQMSAAQVKIAALPAQKSQMTQVAAERDALQTKLKEVTAEAERLRAQVAAQEKTEKTGAAAGQKAVIAQLVAERDALQGRLKEITGELEAVRSQAAKVQEKATTSRNQEALISRTLLSAQKVADDLIQTARTQAEEIIGQANKQAQEARQAATRTQESMEKYVATLINKLETFVSERHTLAKNLATLIESHADSLKSLKGLQDEMQDQILPALDQLSRDIKSEGEKVRRTLAVPPPHSRETGAAPFAEEHGSGPSLRLGEPEQKSSSPAGQDRGGPPALRGEIIVTPVRNHYQAAKLTAGVSRMEGMRFARLRSLSGETAIIEVVAEAGALAKTDFTMIAGVPMEVVETTDTRLVLRVAGPAVHPMSG